MNHQGNKSIIKPFLCCLVIVTLSGCVTNNTRLERSQLSVTEILDRLAAQYASAETYIDEGTVTTSIASQDQIFNTSIRFTTAFQRPDKFRFEYLNLPGGIVQRARIGGIVWQDGQQLGKYFHARPEDRSLESLALGLAAATGVSGSASHRVPAMMLPDRVGGRKLTMIEGASREEDIELEGEDHFVISGRYAGSAIRVWIRQPDYLVSRVQTVTELPNDLQSVSTTTYSPKINVSINPNLLRFNAPP